MDGRDARAQVVGGQGLAHGADVVVLALDGEERRAPDGARIDAAAPPGRGGPRGKRVLLEHARTVSR